MKKHAMTILGALALATGCASSVPTNPESASSLSAIAQAEKDLSLAKTSRGEWRVIDTATGDKALDLSKLLEFAEKKAAEGDIQEAERIAGRVSMFAQLGVAQSRTYMGAKPSYR